MANEKLEIPVDPTRSGQPGDYSFDIFSIKPPSKRGNYLLEKQYLEVSVYEDIFSPNGITGYALINDTLNNPMYVPIVGEELINFYIRSTLGAGDEGKIKFNRQFNTSGLSDQRYLASNQQVYKIQFHSKYIDDSRAMRISQYFSDSASNIIQSIIDDNFITYDDGEEDIEPSASAETDIITCIIPNWYPIDAISWLTERAINNESRTADFLFYETLKGIHFRSLSTLLKQKKVGKFTKEPTGVTLEDSDEQRQPHLYAIQDWFIDSTCNRINNMSRGMYSSKIITHDVTTKKIGGIKQLDLDGDLSDYYEQKEGEPKYKFHYGKQFDTLTHLDKAAPSFYSNGTDTPKYYSSENNVSHHMKHTKMFEKQNDENLFPEKWTMNRQSILQQFNNWSIIVEMDGRLDFTVGDIMEFDIPSAEPLTANQQVQPLDIINSGKYLVSAIRHNFTPEKHMMTVELRRDAWKSKYDSIPDKSS